jgi:hypothetical protein
MKSKLSLVALLTAVAATAAEWTAFEDERFGFRMEIPPGFELSFETEQENGRVFHNDSGDILAVWASLPGNGSFESDVVERLKSDQADSWDISYERMTPDWASYSGTRESEIRYVRAVNLCGRGTAYFIIDYPREAKVRYDSIVTRLVRSMKPTPC